MDPEPAVAVLAEHIALIDRTVLLSVPAAGFLAQREEGLIHTESFLIVGVRIEIQFQLIGDKVYRHEFGERGHRLRIVDYIHKRQVEPRKERAA